MRRLPSSSNTMGRTPALFHRCRGKLLSCAPVMTRGGEGVAAFLASLPRLSATTFAAFLVLSDLADLSDLSAAWLKDWLVSLESFGSDDVTYSKNSTHQPGHCFDTSQENVPCSGALGAATKCSSHARAICSASFALILIQTMLRKLEVWPLRLCKCCMVVWI